MIVWGLLFARFLVPTEGTADGDTLWLTSLTLTAAAGICWWMSRVSFERLRFEKLDFAVWFLCGAHILSALVVIVTEGNKRLATNMLWEWLGIAVLFSLIRQTITPNSRTRFLRTTLVVMTALACYGIWQPTFWYPSNLKEYESLRAELDTVESSTELPIQERARRQQELRAEFVSQGIPLSGPSRQLFEIRLRDSKEPLGFFALANTFAGFMAMALVLLAATLLELLLPTAKNSLTMPLETSRRGVIAAVSAAFLLVAYCLLLTKSRTAWGGTLAGLATLICLLIARSTWGAPLKKLLLIVAVSVVVFSLLTGVAIATGALDVEVVSEASMSLGYRMEYWTSTWDVILNHPVLGTGPGNFRDNYLQYKLPQSSEEISDPHQFILDVAANSGLVGILGLAAFLAMLARLAWPLVKPVNREVDSLRSHAGVSNDGSVESCRVAIAIAVVLTLTGEWLFSSTVSWHVLNVGLLAIGLDLLLAIIQRKSNTVIDGTSLNCPPIAIVAALVTIFVHLSAAGGIAMPAVAGMIFAIAAVLNVDSSATSPAAGSDDSVTEANPGVKAVNVSFDLVPSGGRWLGTALFAGLASVGCAMSAFVPVTQSKLLLQIGDYEAVSGQPIRQVVSLYRSAAAADPLSPEPYIRLSQFHLHQWKQTRNQDFFDQSIEAAEKARSLSPHSSQIVHEIGYAWLVRANAEPDNEQATAAAVEELQNALKMYPTQPTWTAEAAQAFSLAGKQIEAAKVADRALYLDELNRSAGHVDRYLPDKLLAEVKRLGVRN